MDEDPDVPGALIPVVISALNQFLFCPRRCALIHVEGIFAENAATLEGRILHDGVDAPEIEARKGVRIVHALPLFSRRLGLVGKADVVEFHAATREGDRERPYPVEYKRGPRRQWDNDDVQLCAQALCLEEMFDVVVAEGAIFHMRSRRRRQVAFTEELRRQTKEAIVAVRELLLSHRVPLAVLHPKCEGCSVREVCLPEVTNDGRAVRDYLGGLTRET